VLRRGERRRRQQRDPSRHSADPTHEPPHRPPSPQRTPARKPSSSDPLRLSIAKARLYSTGRWRSNAGPPAPARTPRQAPSSLPWKPFRLRRWARPSPSPLPAPRPAREWKRRDEELSWNGKAALETSRPSLVSPAPIEATAARAPPPSGGREAAKKKKGRGV